MWTRSRFGRCWRSFAANRQKKRRNCTVSKGGEPNSWRTKRSCTRLPPPRRRLTCNTCEHCAGRRCSSRHRARRRAVTGRSFSLLKELEQGAPRWASAMKMTANDELLIGLVSISDRASQGVYVDQGIPALQGWFAKALRSPWRMETRLIADDQAVIESTLIELVDQAGCHLVADHRWHRPGGTRRHPGSNAGHCRQGVAGFWRRNAAHQPQFRGHRHTFAPGRRGAWQGADPQSAWAAEGDSRNPRRRKGSRWDTAGQRIFSAVPYCIDLLGGPYVETFDAVSRTFRPKSARPADAAAQG
jgi:molybdopterin adenylyltransferase